MQEANLFLIFLERLNESGLSYMVTGSVASIIYGEPRMTHDIDIVLELYIGDISSFMNLFPSDRFYGPAREIIETEVNRKTGGHFNIIHLESSFKADIYPAGNDELHKWAMSKRQKVRIGKLDIWIAPPEYVIIRKLQYYKEGKSSKHLRDVNRMFEISRDSIDESALNQMIKKYDLGNEWQESRNAAQQ